MAPERIPLFPLEVVLFPGTPLPLHIFEPRYKLMIHHCVERHVEFGVVLARQEGIASVGCTAEVVKIIKTYEDERMDILTMGQNACRVLQVFDEKAYMEGAIEFLEDDAAEVPAETRQRLLTLFEKCHNLIYGHATQLPNADEDVSVAFHVASELPLDLEFKQELLEMRSEPERQTRLLERLDQWLPQLAYVEKMRGKASGNGHGMP